MEVIKDIDLLGIANGIIHICSDNICQSSNYIGNFNKLDISKIPIGAIISVNCKFSFLFNSRYFTKS